MSTEEYGTHLMKRNKNDQEINAILDKHLTPEERVTLEMISGATDGYTYGFKDISIVLSWKEIQSKRGTEADFQDLIRLNKLPISDTQVQALARGAIEKIRTAHAEWIFGALENQREMIRTTKTSQ